MSTIQDVIEERTACAFLDSGVFEKILKEEWELSEKMQKRRREELIIGR